MLFFCNLYFYHLPIQQLSRLRHVEMMESEDYPKYDDEIYAQINAL